MGSNPPGPVIWLIARENQLFPCPVGGQKGRDFEILCIFFAEKKTVKIVWFFGMPTLRAFQWTSNCAALFFNPKLVLYGPAVPHGVSKTLVCTAVSVCRSLWVLKGVKIGKT